MAAMQDSSDKSFKKFTFHQLQCSICSDIFVYPNVINCGHTFCHTCIEKWIEETGNTSNCPICRSEIFFQVPNQVLLGLIEELNQNTLTNCRGKSNTKGFHSKIVQKVPELFFGLFNQLRPKKSAGKIFLL